MPRNGSGVYSPPAGTTATPNTTIESARFNAYVQDVTQDLNTARPVASGGTGGGTGDAAAKNLGLVSAKDLAGTGTVAGTANAITLTTTRQYTALANTIFITFRAGSDIAAGAVTLNLDGLGAKSIRKVVSGGDVDLDVGDILADGYYTVIYDPTANSASGAFILVNGSSAGQYSIGDFFDTARTLGSDWLRRDGSIYDSEDYPDLAELLDALTAGVSWAADTTPPWGSTAPNGIAISATRIIVAVGTSIYWTENGEDWTAVAIPVTATSTQAIAYGGGRWVIIGAGGETTVSTDEGETWSTPTTPLLNTPQGIIFGGGVFAVTHMNGVGTNSKISTSSNGTSWTDRTTPQLSLYRVLVGDSSGLIACDSSGFYYTSLTGDTFSQVTPDITANPILAGAREDGDIVVVGTSGTINTATVLTDLTARTSGTAQALNAVVYSDPFFVTVGNSGVCRISDDAGATWDASITGTSVNLIGLIEDTLNDKLIAIGASMLLTGTKTTADQFRVPADDADYGWIKALA